MYNATIKVLGLGGAGSNAVDRMIQVGIEGVEFIAANTDAQALARCSAPTHITLGPRTARGLGAGGDPARGHAAAQESRPALDHALRGADIVFLAAGMGGGTGTGGILVAAQAARATGALVIAIVTTPFNFEGGRRHRNARDGLEALRKHVHTLIVVPNDRLLQIVPRDMPFEMAFQIADEALRQGVQGIAELITRPGLINLDFANVRALMTHAGGALLSMGQGQGENKVVKAAHAALNHPLLGVGAIDQAAGLLVHITGGEDLGLFEVREAVMVLTAAARADAEVMFGATIDPQMQDRAELILVATGVGGTPVQMPARTAPAAVAAPAAEAAPQAAPVHGAHTPAVHATQPPFDRDDLDVPAYVRRARAV